jgi:uncharacterized lipoprotein YehR (DUF1307 family)
MKKIKILVAVLLVGVMALGLIACGSKTLEGTYVNSEIGTKYTFEGNKFTLDLMGVETSGTYEIDGGKIIFTYDDVKDLAEGLGVENEGKAEQIFIEHDDGSITIGVVKYEKE